MKFLKNPCLWRRQFSNPTTQKGMDILPDKESLHESFHCSFLRTSNSSVFEYYFPLCEIPMNPIQTKLCEVELLMKMMFYDVS